jgi:hypothetical protein
MASKKYAFILGLLALVMTTQAQMSATGGSDWKDSSLIPPSRMAQHNEFLNNQYIFPAKPRNQWELGFKVGAPNISGDVSTVFPTFGYGIHVRKSIGYIVSLRGEFNSGTAVGLNWKDSYNYMNNPAWRNNGYRGNQRIYTGVGNQTVGLVAATDRVFYNYKTKLNDLSAQMLFNLSNIRFHKAEPKFGLYAILGVGVTFYETNIDALNASGQKYNFNSIPGGTYATRNDTKSAIKSLLDGTYETAGETNSQYNKKLFGKTSKTNASFGMGFAFKLSKRINLSLEDKLTILSDDLLDGQRWSASPLGDATATTHYDTYNFLSVGLNINIF